MDTPSVNSPSVLLDQASHGNAGALDQLMPLVYNELRSIAARYLNQERRDHTLQPTALVNEAYIRLIDQNRAEYHNRRHFMAVASEIMRRVLVDHARSRNALKRGGGRDDLALEFSIVAPDEGNVDILVLNDSLARLAELDERQSKIVAMRFFGGLTEAEIADYLGVSLRTVEGDWRMAKAWLRRELNRTR